MKMRFKRFLSGFMAVATLASVIVQPVTVSASELEPEPTSFEQQYPELQDVQDTLDKDEIVEAKDIEIPYGEEFEVEVDLSGIEGVNEKKVKVLFHEAKSEAGTDFDAHTPDTYKAVYAVEPVSGHPAYRVSRNITVKEPETEAQAKSSSENTAGEGNAGETEDSGNADEDADSDGSKEIVTDLTDDQEVTTDEESGLTVSEVMDQAAENGIALYSMEEGEAVTFMATDIATQSTKKVTVTRGTCYQYSDYGYGSYLTYKYEVDVDSNTAYQMDGTSGDVIIEIAYENHPVKGELNIVKQGEVLNGYKDDFAYQKETLEGAVFEVYAAEDIYTADFQKDDNENRILEYASGALVGTIITDKDGKAQITDLPLGTYKIVEKTAPEGFVLNEEAQTVTFEYKDQKTPVIEQTATFENDRQKVEVSVVKQDAETETVVAGAEFGIYAKEDILAHEEVIVKADTLLGKAVSGEDGKAVFDVDLPFGTYYIKELAAPAGYVSSFETLEVTAKYQGQDVKVVELESVFKNQPTKVTFTKSDITTGVELSGATLTVLDKDGNVVDTWKSVKGEEHLIERLTAGETYTLREEMAPYGYLMAEEVSFTVDDTAEIQKVEMKDAVPTGTLIINKKGEFLEKVSALDSIGGWMKHLFEYLSGSLKDVTFEVYALEDIKAADGESEDYYKKDTLVATITTDETGVAKLTDLPLGKYYVKEKETASGYVLDGEIREVDLTYRDQNTTVVTYSADWQNKRQRAEVNVLKKEKDSDRVLEGAVFALCNKEDIVNAKGDVILKADTVIEEQATDKEGKLTFTADLPLGYTYYVKETSPAPGFATTDQVQEFTFEYGGADKETLSYAFTFEDEPTTVELTKTSLTDGKEIEGAKLKVTDESGNTVDEWTSGKEAHIIKELTAGKKYTMTETLPADGYVTAESITFTVEDTSEVQKVEMKDDVTKVQISKTDISGKELPGAKLTILDKDGKTVESWTSEEKPHYIEMLPIGEYTLREENAPDGYLVAEDVKFTVKDTGEIQKVVMKDEAKPEETPTETPTETPEITPTPETKTTEETKKSTSPKTGDNTPILFWILLAGGGMAGLGGTVILRKKKK